MSLQAAIRELEAEKSRLESAIVILRDLAGGIDGNPSPVRSRGTSRRRTLSVAARKRIAAAQRARWAKIKAGKKK